MAILDHITELIAQKGSGFYCIITVNEEITDVVKVIAEGRVIKSILIHGDKQAYGAEDIANMIEMEDANDTFVFLKDVIDIPQPTDEDLIRMYPEECDADEYGNPVVDEQGKVLDFTTGQEFTDAEREHFKEKLDQHYADALRDGNGNDAIPKESAPDLIGRENMDYTIGANDHVNKDKEID